jgi:hypothetical protein
MMTSEVDQAQKGDTQCFIGKYEMLRDDCKNTCSPDSNLNRRRAT